MNILTKEQEKQSFERWKTAKRTVNLSMNFVGAIQCAESIEAAQEKLKRIELRTKQKSELADQETLPELATPIEEDFVEVTYRALSAAMLADRAIDFSDEPMLKRAVKKLQGQTVFKDHETSVDNWVGRVVGTNWDTETKGIPPGINALMRLDAIKDPMVVRGVLQGALHSASVTVTFEWKPSHPKLMEEGTFFSMLGEEVDEDLVRIIVTKIDKFWEISLVWQGADEFAKQIGDDKRVVQQVAGTEEASLTNTSTAEVQPTFGTEYNITVINTEEDMKLLETLKKVLGEEVTEQNAEEMLGKFATSHAAKGEEKAAGKAKEMEETANKEIAKLSDQLKDAEKQITEMKPQAELGNKYLADERQEAIRLCKLAKGEKVSEAILKTLEKCELEVVQAWKAEFKKEAEEKFPAKCASCGGTAVTRQSSKETEEKKETEAVTLGSETAARVQNLHS